LFKLGEIITSGIADHGSSVALLQQIDQYLGTSTLVTDNSFAGRTLMIVAPKPERSVATSAKWSSERLITKNKSH
jgi:hypothetical protein